MNPETPVVITRPIGQADAFARRVAAIGRKAVIFPLLEIRSLDDKQDLQATLGRLQDYAMVAFVSPNAIDAAFSVLRGWPEHVPVAVMGEGSRAALARHGVTPANATILSPRDPDRTDSQTLLAALDIDALRGKAVLIVRGESGRELLADALREAGALVRQVAAYRRVAPELDGPKKAQLRVLLDLRCDWIITSSEALHILKRMAVALDPAEGLSKLQGQHLLVPHARIEETAQALGFQQITFTRSGDEHLLAALQLQA